LSSELHDLRGQAGEGAPGQPAKPIESVLKGFRDDAVHDSSPETAEQHFKLAGTYMEMGMEDEAMKALEVAARSPRHRFRAGAMLGKAYLNAGDKANAIEWFSRAVEAPAPSPQAHHALLYDLALLLESNRESARALAVFLELQAEAGEYRDVSSRLEQLKVQMGS
jgi:tetratricopeptide (TPR) repeat protein